MNPGAKAAVTLRSGKGAGDQGRRTVRLDRLLSPLAKHDAPWWSGG